MLKISHISKTFNQGTVNEKKAIEDLSLELKQGDFATIIGSNGAGKSTLLSVLFGLYQPEEGEIHKDGVKVEVAANIGRPEDVERVLSYDAEGIGLFRT